MQHTRFLIILLFLLVFSSSALAIKWSDVYSVGLPVGNSGAGPSSIVVDQAGNTNILWGHSVSFDMHLYYRKISPSGQTLVGPVLVKHCNTSACQLHQSSMALDSQDNVHIVWNEITTQYSIKYKKLSSTGQTLINNKDIVPPISLQLGLLENPSIGIDTQDNIHLAWYQSDDFFTYIEYQKFTNTGVPLTIPFNVFTVDPANVVLEMGLDGSAHVVGTNRNAAGIYSILYRKFGQDGTPITGVVTLVGPTSSSSEWLLSPSIGVDLAGTVHLAYIKTNTLGPSYQTDVIYSRFTEIGQPIGNPLTMGQFTMGDCSYSTCLSVSTMPSGESLVAWSDQTSSNVFAAHISPEGVLKSPLTTLAKAGSMAFFPILAASPYGTFHLTWAAFTSAVGSTAAQYEVLYSHTLPQKVVILVHGIYSDDTIWGPVELALQKEGYGVYRIGKVLGQKGLVPNNGQILFLSQQLKNAIHLVKKTTQLSKVDVVAHSMGGLVTRAYITTNEYSGDINNLVMLGTPNNGAPLAAGNLAKALGLTGDPGFDYARLELIPESDFLETLNGGYTQKGVRHMAIAGTLDKLNSAKEFSLCVLFPLACPFWPDAPPSDSIVPVSSVNFIGYCTESPVAHSSHLGPSYYTHAPTIQKIASMLKGDTSDPACYQSASIVPSFNYEAVLHQGTIAPSITQPITPAGFFPGKTFAIGVQRTGSEPDTAISFISPAGQTVNASNISTLFNESTYQSKSTDGNTISWYSIPNTVDGKWSAHISNLSATTVNYSLLLLMTRPVSIKPATNQSHYLPGEPVKITATLEDENRAPVLGWTMKAQIVNAANAKWVLSLYDDGTHTDASANDGIYTNSYIPPITDGGLILTTTGNGTYAGNAYTLTGISTFSVVIKPDLMMESSDIRYVLLNSHTNTVALSTIVKNIGNAPAPNATIHFYDGLPLNGGRFIGEAILSLTLGQSAPATINVNLEPGAHIIYITPASDNAFIDADYTNETSTKQVGCQKPFSPAGIPVPGCTITP